MSVFGRIARTGLRRGLRDGSRPWLVVCVAAGALELVRRAVAKEPELVYQGGLEPGERLEIRTMPPEVAENAENTEKTENAQTVG